MAISSGQSAFITGGASGIGLAIARACGAIGMRVMIADIDQKAINSAVSELHSLGVQASGVLCDVAIEQSLRDAAQTMVEKFGKVHILVNNAGVLAVGGAGENSTATWRWIMDVNVMSVVYGVEAFLPLIRRHGEGGYILNTASVGGHTGFAGLLAYTTTKHAVVGYSESLAQQLKGENIGVSVLCPGFTNTRIAETERFAENCEADAGRDSGFVEAVNAGMSPDVVARHALQQMQKNALYIFTHPGTRAEVTHRWQAINDAFDAAERSEIIKSDLDSERIPTKEWVEDLYR